MSTGNANGGEMDLMAKAQRDRDDAEADEMPPVEGWTSRMTSALRRRLLVTLDRMVGLLQGLRQKLAPADVQHREFGRVAPVQGEPRTFGWPRIVMVGAALLLIGLIVGAVFSFSLFAQKIESQIDVIGNQADQVVAYDKETRHAERQLERVKSELKDVRQELEETQADLKKARLNLAGGAGRDVLSATKPRSPESPEGLGTAANTTRYLPHLAPMKSPSGTCRLGYGSSAHDLSACLDQGGQ